MSMKEIKKLCLVLGACALVTSCTKTADNVDVAAEPTTVMYSLDLTVPVPETVAHSNEGSKAIVDPSGDGEIKWEGLDYVSAVPDGGLIPYNLYIQTPSSYDDDMSQLIGLLPGTRSVDSETKQETNLVSFYMYYPMNTESENDPIEVGIDKKDGSSLLFINYPAYTEYVINTDQEVAQSYYESTQAYGEIQPLVSSGVRDLEVSADGLQSREEGVTIDFYPFNVLTTLRISTTGLSQVQLDKIYEIKSDMVVGSVTALDANGRVLENGPFFTQLSIETANVSTEDGIKLADVNTFLGESYANGLSKVENVVKYVDANGNPRSTTINERIVSEPGQAPTLYFPLFTSPVFAQTMPETNNWLFEVTFYHQDLPVLVISKTVSAKGTNTWPVGTFNSVQMDGIASSKTTFDFGPFLEQ